MKISKEDILEIFNQFSGYTDRSRTEQAIHEVNFECLAEAILEKVYPLVRSIKPDMWFIVAVYTNGTVKKILETPFDSSSEAGEVGRTIMESMPVMLEPLFYRWTVLTEEEYLEYEKNGIDLTKTK